jgi:tetratricopeptide (TPR) repeat protein
MSRYWILILVFVVLIAVVATAQSEPSNTPTELVQIALPPLHRVEAPAPSATAAELEQQGDDLRAGKSYLDAIDYYRAALDKQPSDKSKLLNKIGITELMMQRYHDAGKDFDRALRADHSYADAFNNRGVIWYIEKKYPKAIKQYEKAIAIQNDSASFYSNLGAAYFSKKDFEKATVAYSKALQLDPDIFERSSKSGVQAQMSSPEDRAHYDYVLAKLFALSGNSDRSLQYLRRAMEEGYKGIENVYKDSEFAGLRKDPRFGELMAARPPAIPE